MKEETYTLHFRRSIVGVVIVSARKPHCEKIKPNALPEAVLDLFSVFARGRTVERPLWQTLLNWNELISLIGEEEVSKVTKRGKLDCYITITLPKSGRTLLRLQPKCFWDRASVCAVPQEIC